MKNDELTILNNSYDHNRMDYLRPGSRSLSVLGLFQEKEMKLLMLSPVLFISFSLSANPFSAKRTKHFGDLQGVKYVKNYDGDTITVDIPGYPRIIGENISIRLSGIDTPEIKENCKSRKDLSKSEQKKLAAGVKRLAKKAKQRVKTLLSESMNIELRNIQRGNTSGSWQMYELMVSQSIRY